MSDSPFISDFRALLAKHGITTPAFAHGSKDFDPARPRVLYSGPVYDESEIVAGVSALVEGKWAVAGEHTHRFEQLFSKYLNQAESVAVNSGSSADLLMIAAAKKRFGWQDGDGVIVSPCGFPTTISAITLNGLTPVFVDIEWETLNADNDRIEERLAVPPMKPHLDGSIIGDFDQKWDGQDLLVRCWHDTDQTKWTRYGPTIRAILISPVLGNPPDMDRLTELAERYGVKLLLDGCDSLGSTWRGKHLAEYATASSCSFFPSHHISTLQGGMISSNDTELIRIARQMSQWGRACYCVGQANMLPNGVCGRRFSNWLPALPDVETDHKYVYMTDAAYNLQQVDLLSAMGCVQMGKLEAIHAARREAFYSIQFLVNRYIHQTNTAKRLEYADPSWFGVSIICPDYAYKQRLQAHLEAHSIQTRNYFAGNILHQPGYAHLGRAADYPNASDVLKRVFFIGCAPFYTEAHFRHIEETVKSFKVS